MNSKPRVVKDYDKVEEQVLYQIKLQYPYGFDKYLIQFKNAKGQLISALPYETDDRYYLIRMTREEAQEIISEDDDYNDDGKLKESARLEYSDDLEEDLDLGDDLEEDDD